MLLYQGWHWLPYRGFTVFRNLTIKNGWNGEFFRMPSIIIVRAGVRYLEGLSKVLCEDFASYIKEERKKVADGE